MSGRKLGALFALSNRLSRHLPRAFRWSADSHLHEKLPPPAVQLKLTPD